MQRILIADTSSVLTQALEKQLNNDYLVEVCHDGDRALELLFEFEPDILVLDTMIPSVDAITILHTLRSSGRSTKVIATTRCTEDYVLSRLEKYEVSNVLPRPCMLGALVAHIRDVSFQLSNPDCDGWCVENETENILLRLGFEMGYGRYSCVYHGVLIKYQTIDSSATKYVYPQVAKICGGSPDRVEKAIRDAIKKAWLAGDKRIWQMYFQPGRDAVLQCPSNEVFLARIAGCLRQRTRLKKPYRIVEQKAE